MQESDVEPIREVVELPETVAGWTRTDVGEDTAEWWKNGSTHVGGEYEKVQVSRTTPIKDKPVNWLASRTVIDEFGNTINTTQMFNRKAISEDRDYGGWAVDRAVSRMEDFPGDGEFDGKPSIPDSIGRWELVEDEHWSFEWESPQHTIRVFQSELESRYQRTAVRFNTVVEMGENEFVVAEKTMQHQAIRAAVRCMKATDSGFFDVSWSSLEEIKGIGPATSKKLQALGITSEDELEAALESRLENTDPEFESQFETVMTSMIRQSVLLPESNEVAEVSD